MPQAAFYVYPDLAPHKAALARRGLTTGAALADRLLADHGVGVLPGGAFGDDPAALRQRAAASLLYGRTDDEGSRGNRDRPPTAMASGAPGRPSSPRADAGVCGVGPRHRGPTHRHRQPAKPCSSSQSVAMSSASSLSTS